MDEMIRYSGKAIGRVQGVGFRMFVRDNAGKLGLTGWVKNMPDGTVDFEAQGREENLEKLFALLREGNYFIKVHDLELDKINPIMPEKGFVIKY